MTDTTLFFKNDVYDAQLVRTVAAATAGMADMGEALAVARSIGAGHADPDRWHDAWNGAAVRAEAGAREAAAAGHPLAARSGFLRASEYYRQAYFFLRHDLADPRLRAAYASHVATFGEALPLLDAAVRRVRIPYDRTTLHGYLSTPAGPVRPRATLILPCGYDSTAEEGWKPASAAVEHGYAVLTVDAPGQGAALIEQGLYFRPDFEHVAVQLIDWLVEQPEVDAERIGMIGRSFAGYLAPRAATVEHRIAALVCDPAQPDMARRLPGGLAGRVAGPVASLLTRVSADKAEFLGARESAHGVDTPREWFDELARFTMLDDAGRIECPTLVVECEGDFAGGDGQLLFDALTCEKTLLNLTAEQGVGGHCGGLGQTVWADAVYPWLDERLRPNG